MACSVVLLIQRPSALYKRKIAAELEAWKGSLGRKRKTLVVKGLRQVGKTCSVQRFAEENHENVVFLGFSRPIRP